MSAVSVLTMEESTPRRFVAVVLLVLAGCASTNPTASNSPLKLEQKVVGTWYANTKLQSMKERMRITLTINADNTYTVIGRTKTDAPPAVSSGQWEVAADGRIIFTPPNDDEAGEGHLLEDSFVVRFGVDTVELRRTK